MNMGFKCAHVSACAHTHTHQTGKGHCCRFLFSLRGWISISSPVYWNFASPDQDAICAPSLTLGWILWWFRTRCCRSDAVWLPQQGHEQGHHFISCTWNANNIPWADVGYLGSSDGEKSARPQLGQLAAKLACQASTWPLETAPTSGDPIWRRGADKPSPLALPELPICQQSESLLF